LAVLAGCSRSPEAQKARHLERGDRYAAKEQYREAMIEYRNVLRFDAANARAIRQLGIAHSQLGELAQAFRYLLKAQELTPDDLEARLKLGAIYLFGGKREEAREQATYVLGKDPKNLDALALLGDSATTSEDVDATIRRLEAARAELGDRAKIYLTLGVLYLRKGDLPKAERAFQDAIAREPKSVEAHSLLGSFYLSKRDVVQAEREFKAAADLAPMGSLARLKLADFYLLAQKPDEAKRMLLEMTQKAPDFLPAWRLLAEIALRERNYDESSKALQTLLKKNPSDVEGHLLLGRLRLAKGETSEAIQEFQQVLKVEPGHAVARYQLALAQIQAGNVQQAKGDLKEAIAVAPNYTEAVLRLAELNIQTGAIQPAIEDLERFLARQPGAAQARALLGSAYLAKEPARATETFRKLVALAPKDPRWHYLTGVSLRVQGRSAEAKGEFEAALILAPSYVEPVVDLAGMALDEKQPDVALNRVTRQIALVPKSAGLQYLLGVVHLARRETTLAEAAFLKGIELDPNLVDAYVRLGGLYKSSGR